MRYHTPVSENLNAEFFKANYQTQGPFDHVIKNLQVQYGIQKGLTKFDSSSSLSDSGHSEDSREDNSQGKHQQAIERRHKNFQVKKKTEVKFFLNQSSNIV